MRSMGGRQQSVLVIVVVLVAGAVYYVLGGRGGGKASTDEPYNAFEVRVGPVSTVDGTFLGRIEPADRYADEGRTALGTDDQVRLRLADLTPIDRVRDDCWADEGVEAIDDALGSRIQVSPTGVRRDGNVLRVYAWDSDGEFINEKLLRDGDARFFERRAAPRYRDELQKAQASASDAKRGRWGACGTA